MVVPEMSERRAISRPEIVHERAAGQSDVAFWTDVHGVASANSSTLRAAVIAELTVRASRTVAHALRACSAAPPRTSVAIAAAAIASSNEEPRSCADRHDWM